MRTGLRVRLLLGVLLAAGALAQPAWAEGEPPGSPLAIRQDPGAAIPWPGVDAAATAAQPTGLGGAVFNPFAEAAAPAAARQAAAPSRREPEGPGYTLTVVVALACAAALTWLCRRAWTAAG